MEDWVHDKQRTKNGDKAQDSRKGSRKGSSKGSRMGAPEPAQSTVIAKNFQCWVCHKSDGHNHTTCLLLRTLWSWEPLGQQAGAS